jgi:imidazolonepropionase-like amidohydrolase
MAAKLHKAGVTFCIANGGGASNNRNLPYLAGKAMAFGLPQEEALRSITIYPARILGVDDRFGSIEPGKSATFFVADGDILDIRTEVTMAYIMGKQLDLTDRHKRLYERYRKRPEPQGY